MGLSYELRARCPPLGSQVERESVGEGSNFIVLSRCLCGGGHRRPIHILACGGAVHKGVLAFPYRLRRKNPPFNVLSLAKEFMSPSVPFDDSSSSTPRHATPHTTPLHINLSIPWGSHPCAGTLKADCAVLPGSIEKAEPCMTYHGLYGAKHPRGGGGASARIATGRVAFGPRRRSQRLRHHVSHPSGICPWRIRLELLVDSALEVSIQTMTRVSTVHRQTYASAALVISPL